MKYFNTTTVCVPEKHYMVDLSTRVQRIVEQYIDREKYFTITRARQYGKTTLLLALERELSRQYHVLSISFEWIGDSIDSEQTLVNLFVRLVDNQLKASGCPEDLIEVWNRPIDAEHPFLNLDMRISALCARSDRPIVLMIDEVDKASSNAAIIPFLGLLRDKYIRRSRGCDSTFQNVILAGVYDIRNLKIKLRPEAEHQYNSPWNVAAMFDLDMAFSVDEIASMLSEYRADHDLEFDVPWFARQIFAYTSGYPFLVSRFCEILDGALPADAFSDLSAAWTQEGFRKALNLLLQENNPLFDDLNKKLNENPALKKLVERVVINRESVSFLMEDSLVQLGNSFGWFCPSSTGKLILSNRIFEVRISNMLINQMESSELFQRGDRDAYQLKSPTELYMDRIMERFAVHYAGLYADQTADFLEKQGRMLFLTFLRPIINGVGNYYLEAQWSDGTRTDVVIDYRGKQYIVELKIWHGDSYQENGREQLCGYLESYQQSRGWLLSFCFNRNKKQLAGTRCHQLHGKTIMETVV